MFSSFTSFLPSLHLPGVNERNGPTSPFNPINTVEEQEAECEAENAESRPSDEENVGKKGKTRGPNETFIFVRPPPAKSNHPLNLQVQLVPPAPQRQSIDSEPDTPVSTTTLSRTSSNRSEASSYGSTASLSSMQSTSTSGSGRRTIIPLYNLQAHNVMTNVIVDAGTDAKIAKFQRRGIELIDLALLEPVEVWGERNRPAKASRPVTPDPASTTAASSSTSLPSTAHSQSITSSPQASNPSLLRESSPSGLVTKQNRLPEPKRNIFGKMFKKGKETPPASPTAANSSLEALNTRTPTQATPRPEPTTPTQNQLNPRRQIRPVSSVLSSLRERSSSPSKRSGVGLGLTVPGQEARRSSIDLTPVPGSPNPTPGAASQDEKILRPPVLGIQPTLSFSYTPAGNSSATPAPLHVSNLSKAARALMYVWFVRRWFKLRADEEDNGGLLSVVRHAKRNSNLSLGSGNGGPADEVEVRFEWKRSNAKKKAGKDKEKDKDRGRRSRPGTGRSRKDMAAAAAGEDIKEKDFQPSPNIKNKRLSVASNHSVSTTVSVSEEGHGNSPYMRRSQEGVLPGKGGDEYDDGEDSDPEDSETPWICTLKIRRTGGGGLRPSASSLSVNQLSSRNGKPAQSSTPPQVLRIKVGTLSPTPHHPKVVGMLKVPFPLPDIEVERMGVVPRPMGPPGVRPPPSQWPGTTLTAEEIKDVVCSTGLWLVVREGFGGVGKVSRKGDGWRIRA